MDDLFSFTGSAVPDGTALVGFRGREAMSTCYRFDVFVEIPRTAGFAATSAIGTRVTLSLADDGRPTPFDFQGVVCEVAILLSREPTDLYRFTFEPALAALTRSRHSRMYTDKSAVDVVKDVLGRAGLTSSSDFRVQGSYAPEEHVCQYKESDLAFISRWLEREGIAYWFEHGDSEEKCVFTDDPSAHEPLDPTPVRYRPTSGEDASRGESFHRFTATAVARPASVKLVDNDYMKPDLDVSSSSNVVPTSASVVIEHGNRTFTPSEASRVAKLRAAELFAGASVYRGEGAVFHLRPGYAFELSEHPRDAVNQKYLVTSIEHVCNLRAHAPELAAITGLTRRESYGASVTAIPASVPFRPPRATPRPRISGFEAAVVDGPATSDYAQLDDQGRYKVKFHFDESDLSGGKGTTWLRMVQPHAGNPEGFHFPLRSGTEVFVAFVGGDPDRPIIAGAVHNAETPNPVTSANNTKNVVQTGGNTRIEIEDQDGSQYSHISTPTQSTYLHAGAHAGGGSHNVCEVSSGNCLFDIGTNLDIQVDAKLTETVTGDVTETYNSGQTSTVTGPQTSTTGGMVVETYKAKQTTEVGGTVTETYDAPHMSLVSGGLRDETFMGGQTTGVTGPTVELYGGTHGTSVGGATKQAYIGPLMTVVSGAYSQHVSGAVTLVQGPTVAILASLNIDVKGACDIFTSSWNVITSPSFIAATTTASWGGPTTNTTFALGLYGVKAEVGGVGIAGNTLKVEGTALTIAAYGANIAGWGMKFTGQPVENDCHQFVHKY
ncbi:MAG TPA: type VI secretion system tip protein TssI/VgrG [Byssovorax sp.]|jgi:type VI secretion system secreted protein VgrG